MPGRSPLLRADPRQAFRRAAGALPARSALRSAHASLPADVPGGQLCSIGLVEWAEELAHCRLAPRVRRQLQVAQASLLLSILALDAALDRDPRFGGDAASVPLLLFEWQRRLAPLFPPGSRFWRACGRLQAEHARALRWERAARGRRPRFGAVLAERLGSKAALLRWPAWAVPELAGRARASAAIDAAFARLFRVLQLLDDLADAPQDAVSGQPNAVLAAGGRPRGAVGKEVAIVRGARVVAAAVRRELRLLKRSAPRGSRFRAACGRLAAICQAAERQAVSRARARAGLTLLSRLAASEPRTVSA